ACSLEGGTAQRRGRDSWRRRRGDHTREGASQIAGVVLISRVRGVRFDIDDYVERALVDCQRLALPPVDLPSPALQTIANVGFPELFRRRDADPGVRQGIGGEEQNDVAGNDL